MFYYNYKYKIVNKFSMLLYHVKLNGANIGLTWAYMQKTDLYVAGADGVLQAMTLSYGALKFSNHHLEFGTHPRDLHRDYFFRRINYGNDTHVNISVQVGDDNKAVLYVSLDRNNRPYYACDAGCLDAPEALRYSAFYSL